MRTPYRIATTLVALVAVFPIGAGAAHAGTAQPVATQATWFWADNSVAIGPESTNPPAQLSGVPDKDLAVSSKGQADTAKPDKVSYLAFDVSAIPVGSTISKFTVTLKVDTQPAAVTAQPSDVKLVACGAIGDWPATAAGQDFSLRPGDDCSALEPGEYDATAKTWTFDIAPYADVWAKGTPAYGIGILPAPDYANPFQIVFQPADTVTTSVEYTPPAPVPAPTTTVAPNPVPQPPVSVAGPPPITSVTVPQPQVQPVPAPTVALVPSRPVQPVRALVLPKKSGLPPIFWLGALAAVALLGVASMILGDTSVPAAETRHGTVTRSLRERQARRAFPSTRPAARMRTV